MIHELKILPKYFNAVISGEKTFEIRKNDRPFHKGDLLALNEFDGEPIGGTVAVSSVGTQNNKNVQKLFLQGYNEMILRLQPSLIYFYGNVPEECMGNIIQLTAFQNSMELRCRKG